MKASPITGKEMLLQTRTETMSYRKENFEVLHHYYFCEDSKNEFTDTDLDEINTKQIYNQYRAKHKLPFPEEIKKIRESYGIPANKMAEILGFGINIYRQYEAGDIPNDSNARLIQLAKNPKQFKELLLLSGIYQGNDLEKILTKIETLIDDKEKNLFDTFLEQYLLGNKEVNAYTGYCVPNLQKFSQMLVFFAESMNPYKTKLNKLLFYADFLHYKRHQQAISGVSYRAINMGPVPNGYDKLFSFAIDQNLINVQHEDYANGTKGEKFIAIKSFDKTIFEESELEILEEVKERFLKTNTSEIINISHQEPAWIENEELRTLVDFKYGLELKAF